MLFLLWTFIDIVGRSGKMLAKFEKRAYAGSERVWVGKYRNLHNIAHWHMEHELIACAEGSAKVMLDDTTYRLAPNQCVFCQSGSVHSIEADPDSLLYVCLFLRFCHTGISARYAAFSGPIRGSANAV